MKNGVLVTVIAAVLVLGIVGYIMFSGSLNKNGIYANNPTTTTPNTTTNSQNNPATTTTQLSISNVAIQGYAFSQPALTIKVGDIVVWTNMDSAPHTVTSDSGSELSSSSLSNGQTYSHTFTTAGTYSYHCGIHPNMKATVTVQ